MPDRRDRTGYRVCRREDRPSGEHIAWSQGGVAATSEQHNQMPIKTSDQPAHGSIGPTGRPKVFSLNPLRPKALKLARSSFDLVLPSDENAGDWREKADGILVVGASVTQEDLDQASQTGRLRYISKQGAGVDKIHVPTAKKHGITVMNTPGVNAQAVAELAFGMMIT